MKKSKMTQLQAIKLTLKGIKRANKRAIEKIRKELGNNSKTTQGMKFSKIDLIAFPLNLIKLRFGYCIPSFAFLFEDPLKTVSCLPCSYMYRTDQLTKLLLPNDILKLWR